MSTLPTPDQMTDFERDGVVCLRGVIDVDWIDRLRVAIDRDMANPGAEDYGYPSGFYGNRGLWKLHPECDDYCRNSPLPALAARFFGAGEVRLYFDQLFVKEPGSLSPTPWHNDQPYWAISGAQVMSFWLALDSVTQESGAVEYIGGSHRWNRWFQPASFADTDRDHMDYEQNKDYEPVPDFDAQREELNVISFDVEPGDIIAFHALTVHGAGGNKTADRRRRGYTVRYIGDDVRYDPRAGTNKKTRVPGLQPGAVMDHARYPLVWPRAA